MTKEQIQKVLEFNKRIEKLNEAKAQLRNGYLMVARKFRDEGNDRYDLYAKWQLLTIWDILKSHKEQILSEIDLEIESIKEELEKI